MGCLLEGLEIWCRDSSSRKISKGWVEEGRSYRFEKNSNRAGRYVVCFVVDAGAKRFCIVISKGRGFPRGWSSLATKLQSLGVASPAEGSTGTSSSHPSQGFFRREREDERSLSFAEVVSVELKRLGNFVWFHLGGKDVSFRKEPVAQWLVGS